MRIFRFHGMWMWFCLWPWLVAAQTAPSLLRVHGEGAEPLEAAVLMAMAEEITSEDLNFPGDGPAVFRGVRIAKLLEAQGNAESVILFSDDQYVIQMGLDFVREKGGLLAWSQNGSPIPRHKGGPQKLVFEHFKGLHPSTNAWYVTAFIPGKAGEGMPLRLVAGDRVDRVAAEEALRLPGRSREMLPPVPKGYRQVPVLPVKQQVSGFVLEDLLKSRNLSWESVVLRPLAGREVRLNRKEVEGRDLFLFAYKNGVPLSLCCGGPWAFWIPVLTYPDLAGRLPNPDALFFVHEILVE